LWNAEEYSNVIDNLSDIREVMDVFKYLSLVKEGTDAVRTKNAMEDGDDNDKDGVGGNAKNKKKKRSRRFDRDYYRTCVSQGLHAISYQFVLSPFRAGIKLEDNHTLPNGFNWDKVLAGEKATVEYDVGDTTWPISSCRHNNNRHRLMAKMGIEMEMEMEMMDDHWNPKN